MGWELFFDYTFSFKLPRIVRVNDWRLGALNAVFVLMLVIYFILVEVLQKGG